MKRALAAAARGALTAWRTVLLFVVLLLVAMLLLVFLLGGYGWKDAYDSTFARLG